MTCRQFEDGMSEEFGAGDWEKWRPLLIQGAWDKLTRSAFTEHLAQCADCETSIFQFFEVRHLTDYRAQPCFHVAYWSATVPGRCLDRTHGIYSILTDPQQGDGVVIAFCPWCGINLPSGR